MSGARPHTIMIAAHDIDATMVARISGTKTSCSASCSKSNEGTRRAVQDASSAPSAAPVTEIRTASDSSCRAIWTRLAPSAMRTLDSRDLLDDRDSRNVATFAQATKKTAHPADVSKALIRAIPPDTSGDSPV